MKDIYPLLLKNMTRETEPENIKNSGVIGVSWASSGGEAASILKDNCLAADGIENVIQILGEIENEKLPDLSFVELLACPGGCIGGGGQPLHHGKVEILNARRMAVYQEDCNKPLRKSHENPYIQQLYEEFLGKPLGEKAHKLLHTHYFSKSE